jgi:hypothetical protein
MTLNDIQLPAHVIAGLYKHLLVEESPANASAALVAPAEPVAVKPATAAKKPIQFLGKNQKNIALLVNYADYVYLPEEQLNFLTAILQACKMNMGDVAIVNQHTQPYSFNQLKEQLGCTHLLLFGIEASAVGLQPVAAFTSHQVNDCHIVYCPVLDLFTNDADGKLLKSKLWLCLKQLFNI